MEENKVFLRVIPEGEKGAELMGRLEKIRKSALSIFPAITEIRMPSEEAEGFYAYVAPDGSTLAEHLERERPLELAKAIRVEEKLWDAYEKMSSMGIRHGTLNPYLIYLDGEEIVLDYFEANAAEEDDQARIRQILNGLKEGGCLQTGEFQTDRSMAGRFRRFFQTLRG
ncbi:MAG: hypothetical protein LIP11_17950 [Clostridiales bacterium]|nr:hypothetical protein [Clostridiales bacterium]